MRLILHYRPQRSRRVWLAQPANTWKVNLVDRKINLLSATSEELDHFTRSRRAQARTKNKDFRPMPAQLNATEIATTFDAEHYRLTEVIRSELLEGGNDKRPLQLLANHLKVYG
jgi:hypothetical protein